MNDQLYQNGLGNLKKLTQSSYLRPNGMIFVDSSSNSAGNDQIMDFISNTTENTDILPNYADPELIMSLDGVPIDPPLILDSSNLDVNSLTDIVSEMNESTAEIINEGENVLSNLFGNVTSSVTTSLTNANEAVDSVINEIVSFINKSGESAGNKLTGISSELKEASGKAGFVALDVIRRTIIVVEDSLIQGAKTVGYAYSSSKEFLPSEFQEVLNLSEESVAKVLNPAGNAFRQVYMAVEGFEESIGLDPNDPLIPFVFFLGLSATLWGSYRILKYSGYAGDLSPQSTLELLRGNENVVLVDIRPEARDLLLLWLSQLNVRERDGIPDLRRTARFRYASVALPEIDGSLKKLLKGGRDIEDTLLAAVIRNLKIVEDRSKVLVMDADGTRSKGIARSLRKLGTKASITRQSYTSNYRPYLVQGGFRSWVKEGFRIKMLKPETALTILNEEAEAILEEINPTPLKIIGFGVGFVAAAYSLAEWEKTLQFVGVIGLGQTIYRRLASYQDAEDFKQDVRLLLAPVRLGGQAISWASGKLDTNRNGLPTSPSLVDVQSRVLQAAAKHESQPSDTEGIQDSSSQIASSDNGNVHTSEA
ncbi:hypothetical protein DH2020_041573 [Rehmannia glutinosa]|uniref:Rhodanese domain-containing protein n=1 Tax=Rehmannia glutinosa TaxID=99300 RepID=A0ABR0UR98_REHGL